MKIFLAIVATSFLFTANTWACHNLQGMWTCYFQNKTEIIEIYQKNQVPTVRISNHSQLLTPEYFAGVYPAKCEKDVLIVNIDIGIGESASQADILFFQTYQGARLYTANQKTRSSNLISCSPIHLRE